MFQVYFEYIKNLVMKYTSSILWTCFWNAFVFKSCSLTLTLICISFLTQVYLKQTFKIYVFLVKHRSILEINFLNLYTYLHSNLEVYLKYTFWIDAFIFKLRGILEVDFLNLCIYVQAQKHASSRLSKLMHISIFKLRSILEVDFLNLSVYVQT